MITRNYKDYTIVLSKFENNIGNGFRASFYVAKDNGLKECHQLYETYRRKTFKAVVEDVKRIIDALA